MVALRGWLFILLTALPAGGAALQSDPLEVGIRARAMQPGEVVRLDVHAGQPLNALDVTAFGRAVQAFRVDGKIGRAHV